MWLNTIGNESRPGEKKHGQLHKTTDHRIQPNAGMQG